MEIGDDLLLCNNGEGISVVSATIVCWVERNLEHLVKAARSMLNLMNIRQNRSKQTLAKISGQSSKLFKG